MRAGAQFYPPDSTRDDTRHCGNRRVLSLLLMRIQIDNSIQNKTSGMSKYVVHVDYDYGYWLAILFFYWQACLTSCSIWNG